MNSECSQLVADIVSSSFNVHMFRAKKENILLSRIKKIRLQSHLDYLDSEWVGSTPWKTVNSLFLFKTAKYQDLKHFLISNINLNIMYDIP